MRYTIITKDHTHRGLNREQMSLKECFYRALKQDYQIIYPDKTVINVQFRS